MGDISSILNPLNKSGQTFTLRENNKIVYLIILDDSLYSSNLVWDAVGLYLLGLAEINNTTDYIHIIINILT